MKFKSESNLWLGLLVWIPITFLTVYALMDQGLFIKIIMIATFIFLAWIWLGTYYLVSNTTLTIKSGPFTENIPIKDIKNIRSTKNTISSPALSLNRLQIRYGYSKVVLISPKERQKFVDMILEKNNKVIVNIKEYGR